MTSLRIIDTPSPNHESRAGPIDLVVLHYTGMQSGDVALRRLTDPAPIAGDYPGPWQSVDIDPKTSLGRVSAHYLVMEDGLVHRLVDEDARAWHAGISFWEGRSDTNDRAIGIEIVNGGHDFGLPDFPSAQILAVMALVRDILMRRHLGPHQVVGHADVAPARKLDPGEKFPWRLLAEQGLALWSDKTGADGPRLAPGEQGEAVLATQEALAAIGYGVVQNGLYDAATAEVVAAFQRRFRPERVDGLLDSVSAARLADIAAQKVRLALPKTRS
jgi:N-acetylmuramoyl-L-alanine amidase